MNANIVSSLIASGTSLIVCFVGLFLGQRQANNIKAIQREQLEKVFVPLDKLFFFSHSPKEILEAAYNILNDNYALIPVPLWKELHSLHSDLMAGRPVSYDLRKLQSLCSTYYEWTRKELGFPYNAARINPKFSPSHSKIQRAIAVFRGILFILLLALMLLAFIASFFQTDFSEIVDRIGSISLPIIMTAFLISIFFSLTLRGQR